MYIDDFIWLPDIIEKLGSKHGVWPEEVEEVFFNRPLFRFIEKGHVAGENVYVALARDMSSAERKRYGRK